jgi:hypothetical protein
MSALVGALLFARAIDDPAESAAILRTMRRRLRAEFAGEAPAAKGAANASDGGHRPQLEERRGAGGSEFSPSHDLLRAF